MKRLSREGLEGHLVRIVDPAEEDFPYAGRTRFESPRGGADELFGRAERIRSSYRARFTAHGEKIADAAMKLGWTCTVHRTDHDRASFIGTRRYRQRQARIANGRLVEPSHQLRNAF